MALKDDLLAGAVADLAKEDVTELLPPGVRAKLPAGQRLYVAELSGTDRDSYEAGQVKIRTVAGQVETDSDLSNLRAKLVVRSLVTADGRRVFGDGDAAAVGAAFGGAALDRLAAVARRLSGLGRAATEDGPAAVPFAASPTASPSCSAGPASAPASPPSARAS